MAPPAVRLAKKLCQLTGERYPKDVDLLGCAYAAAGRSRQATAAWKKALAIAQRIRDYPVAASAARHLLSSTGNRGLAEASSSGTEADTEPARVASKLSRQPRKAPGALATPGER